MHNQPRVLLAGCGRLGQLLAQRLAADGFHVTALRRRKLSGPGIHRSVAADLTNPASLHELDKGYTAVIYSPTPDKREAEAYRKTFCSGLKNLLRRPILAAGGRLIFVSSTAVYGQNHGEIVTEDSPTEPTRFNGRILLEAEQLALASGHAGTVLRLGGLYGNKTSYVVQKLLQGELDSDTLHHWTNRIHLEDAAGLIAHLLTLPQTPARLNGVDDHPCLRFELFNWLALEAARRLPALDLDKKLAQLKQLSLADHSGTPPHGKRISNALSRSLGYDYQYPDFRTGYIAVLDSLKLGQR